MQRVEVGALQHTIAEADGLSVGVAAGALGAAPRLRARQDEHNVAVLVEVRAEAAQLIAVLIGLNSERIGALAASTDEDVGVDAIKLDKLNCVLVVIAAADDAHRFLAVAPISEVYIEDLASLRADKTLAIQLIHVYRDYGSFTEANIAVHWVH